MSWFIVDPNSQRHQTVPWSYPVPTWSTKVTPYSCSAPPRSTTLVALSNGTKAMVARCWETRRSHPHSSKCCPTIAWSSGVATGMLLCSQWWTLCLRIRGRDLIIRERDQDRDWPFKIKTTPSETKKTFKIRDRDHAIEDYRQRSFWSMICLIGR